MFFTACVRRRVRTVRLLNIIRDSSRRFFSSVAVPKKNTMDCKEGKVIQLPRDEVATSELFSDAIDAGVGALKAGHVIAVPTDTLYGVAGLAQSPLAVERLYELKKRDVMKPIAICVSNVADISRFAEVSHVPVDLLNALLPGPVTVCLQRKLLLNPALNPHTSLIAIRVPGLAFVKRIIEECNSPIALTSANISAGLSPNSIDEFKELWADIEVIFDVGPIVTKGEPFRSGSTVVDLSKPGFYRIVRAGCAEEATTSLLKSYSLVLSTQQNMM